MSARTAAVERTTAETSIRLTWNLDGTGKAEIASSPLWNP